MAMTISEKILARAPDRKEVYPYEMLEVRVDMTLSDEKTGPPFFEVFDGLGIPIWDGEKAAIFSDHDDLAYELAPYGINVDAICPGATLTPLLKSRATPAQIAKEALRTPAGKLCGSEDIADAVLFLCSERAKMILGQVLDVDAGELLAWTDSETYRQSRKDYAKKYFGDRVGPEVIG